MNNPQRSLFFNVDWIAVILYLCLCTIGWFNIHSAAFDPRYPSAFDMHTDYGKQLVFIIVAISLAIIVLLLESRFLVALAPAIYGITTLLLMLVLVVGRNVGGNQAWISLGGGFRLLSLIHI